MPKPLLAGARVINIGLSTFAESLAEATVPSVNLDWRPPAEARASWLAALLTGETRIDKANAETLDRIVRGHPVLIDVRPAREVIPGMTDYTILHAGPPVTWDKMCGPMRGAVAGALMYEGLAPDVEAAVALAARGRITFSPCHEHQAVGPMAGVIAPSMPVMVVENRTFGNRAYATMNEGWGRTLRFGAFDPPVIQRLNWMRGVLGPGLAKAIKNLGGVDIKRLTAQALHMGDECHNRDLAGTSLFYKLITAALAAAGLPQPDLEAILAFLSRHEHFFLNISMAACKATLEAAAGIPFSSVVTTIARNGVEVGIRVSGLGERWFTAPAEVPRGLYFPGYSEADANPDMGDSAISETAGIGAFAMAASPAIVMFVGGTPAEATQFTKDMYEITVGVNPNYTIPALDFAGTPTAVDVRKVVQTGILPVINTGIAHKEPGHGLVGAGVVRVPPGCFSKAVEALYETFTREGQA